MKKLFLGSFALVALVVGSATAAELPVKAPAYRAPAVVPIYDWSGFYIGGHGGYAWAHHDWHRTTGAELVSPSAEGGFGGGQVGFNWQTGVWVLGVEAQASWTHLRKGDLFIDPNLNLFIDPNINFAVPQFRLGNTLEQFGTIAGRIGYAFDRWLPYVKAGGTWAHSIARIFDVVPGGAERLAASTSDDRWGWMVGGGLEYGLTANWSAKVEFDYLDFGTRRLTFINLVGGTPPALALDIRQTISLVKVGINYRFGPTVIAARY